MVNTLRRTNLWNTIQVSTVCLFSLSTEIKKQHPCCYMQRSPQIPLTNPCSWSTRFVAQIFGKLCRFQPYTCCSLSAKINKHIIVFMRSAHHKSLNQVTAHGQHVSSHKSLKNDTCLNRILVFLLPRRSTQYIPVFASTIHHRSLNKVPAHGHMLAYGTNCVKCLIHRQVMAINRSSLQMAASVKVKPQRL